MKIILLLAIFILIVSVGGGSIGVRFGGFHASAGLTNSGLHAEAGTPFGQGAHALLGGSTSEAGSHGGLYAGATAGGDISAGAGIAGSIGNTATVTKTFTSADTGTYTGSQTYTDTETAIKYTGTDKKKGNQIATYTQQKVETPVARTTVIERTVIPNYVEKTVQIPTYEEKIIKVPTFVEKRIRVPVEPKVVERTISEVEIPISGQIHKKGETTIINTPSHSSDSNIFVHKSVSVKSLPKPSDFDGEYSNSGVFAGILSRSGVVNDAATATSGSISSDIDKNTSGFIDNIFNIPISTLRAVNRLVSGITGGLNGQFLTTSSVSKSY